jgi:hypothetical protein
VFVVAFDTFSCVDDNTEKYFAHFTFWVIGCVWRMKFCAICLRSASWKVLWETVYGSCFHFVSS